MSLSAPFGSEVSRRNALDDRIREMLRDLGRALADAIAESSDVNEALERLQREGYGLIILLDRRRNASDRQAPRARLASVAEGARGTSLAEPGTGSDGVPVFRINGGDLAFLKSIGIDPTRRVRGRRSAERRPDAEV